MTEINPQWLKDDSTVYHKLVRILLFLTSFSWTLNPIQDYMGDSSPIEKILTRMIPMAIVAVYCMTCRYKDRIKHIFRPELWGLLWYVICGVGAGLSSIQPALCAWKGAEILIVMMWVCVSCRDKTSMIREFFAITRYLEILLWVTVVLAIIRPSMGFMPSHSFLPWIRGYFPLLNPNTLGFLSVVTLTRLMFLPATHKPVRLFLVTGVLMCAQSRTSYAVVALALVVYLIDAIRRKQIWFVVLSSFCALMALLLAFGWLDLLLKVIMRGESIEEVSTLSGRTDYWEFALQHVSWQGHGFAVGSRSLIFLDSDLFKLGSVNMHNSFIEALIGAGYIGAVPFLLVFLWNAIKQLFRTCRHFDVMNAVFLVYVIMFIARSMTSIALALFSFDFAFLMMFWAWLWNSKQATSIAGRERPKPVVYEKTLHEMHEEASKSEG